MRAGFRCLLIALAGSVPLLSVAQETGGIGVRPSFFASGDNEDFDTLRTGVDLLRLSGEGYTGIRYRHHAFRQAGWSRSADQVAWVAKGGESGKLRAWQAEAGVSAQGGHALLTLDANLAIPLGKRLSSEVFLHRDYVETRPALEQGTHYNFLGASLDYAVHPQLTLVGLGGQQRFSDDNRRNHARLRLIYQPDLDLGLTFQYRYRGYRSTPSATRRPYFSPESYHENMLLTGWRQRHQGWMTNLLAGLGVQDVAGQGGMPSRLLEISLDSPAKSKHVVSLRAGYLQSASFGGPDYRYRYIQGHWTLRF